MNKKYIVKLSSTERKQLKEIIAKGKAPAYKIKHANILLKAEAGWSDEKIAQAFDCNVNTPRNVRQRLVEQGLDVALERKKQGTPSREKILDGKGEAHLLALSCSQPPEGRARWTLHLLADKLIELQVVDRVSYETVRRILKKMS
jgi:transposase